MNKKLDGLWYVSQPSRLGGTGKEVYREQVLCELIAKGYHVIHPFNALPFSHFEGNAAIGRELAMQYCCDLVDMCEGRILVTGISEGVLLEVEHALQTLDGARIEVFPEYDPEWNVKLQEFEGEAKYQLALKTINMR